MKYCRALYEELECSFKKFHCKKTIYMYKIIPCDSNWRCYIKQPLKATLGKPFAVSHSSQSSSTAVKMFTNRSHMRIPMLHTPSAAGLLSLLIGESSVTVHQRQSSAIASVVSMSTHTQCENWVRHTPSCIELRIGWCKWMNEFQLNQIGHDSESNPLFLDSSLDSGIISSE